jgi:hypothetical protein
MKWINAAAATLLMGAPLLISSTAAGQSIDKHRPITMRGCVQDGATKGHYVLRNFAEVPPAGGAATPEYVQGRKVAFWLEDLPKLDKHFNQMVEVKGEVISTTEAQTEPKIQDGQFIVEVEGPGRDVDLTAAQAREAIGTTGTERQKLLLVRVDVDDVKAIGPCTAPAK